MPALRLPDTPLTDGVVVIRPRRQSDAEAVIAACQDPEIPRWTQVPENYTRAHWDAWWEDAAAQSEAGTGLHLAIVDPDDQLLGAIGLVETDLERGYTEIGYWLAREARGHGYAARAVRLLAGWARAELSMRTIELLIYPENTASRRVALAAGFVENGRREAPARCGPGEIVVYTSSEP